MKNVWLVRRLRLPPTFRHHMPVPQKHEAVHRIDLLIGSLDKLENALRGDSLRFRRTTRQGCCSGSSTRENRKRQGTGQPKAARRYGLEHTLALVTATLRDVYSDA